MITDVLLSIIMCMLFCIMCELAVIAKNQETKPIEK